MKHKKLFWNTAIYTFFSIIQSALGFLLLPVFTSYMSPESYGTWNLLFSYIYLLTIGFTLCLDTSVLRFHFSQNSSEDEYKTLLGTNVLFQIFLCFVITLAFLVVPKTTLDVILGVQIPKKFIGILLFSTGLSSVFKTYLAFLSAKQDGKRNGLLNFLSYICFSLLSALLSVYGFGYEGFLYSKLVTEIVFFAIAIAGFGEEIIWKFDARQLKKSLKYSLPLIPHYLSGWIMVYLARVVLNGYDSTVSVGIYSLGFQFGNVINIVIGRFHEAYMPWFYEHMKLGEYGKASIVKISNLMITGYATLLLLISLFSPEIVRLVTAKAYHGAWAVAPIISMAGAFGGLYYFYIGPCFNATNGTRYATYVSFGSSFVHLLLSFLLIPRYGVFGAAITSLCSSAIMSVFAIIASKRFERPMFEYGRHYTTIIVASVLSCSTFIFSEMFSGVLLVFMKILLIALIASFAASVFKNEMSEFKKLWSFIRNPAR